MIGVAGRMPAGEILEEKRHAAERSVRQRGTRFGAGTLVAEYDVVGSKRRAVMKFHALA